MGAALAYAEAHDALCENCRKQLSFGRGQPTACPVSIRGSRRAGDMTA